LEVHDIGVIQRENYPLKSAVLDLVHSDCWHSKSAQPGDAWTGVLLYYKCHLGGKPASHARLKQ
jgi:hypothetical protein